MLPKDYNNKQPISFVYYDKLARGNLQIVFNNEVKQFFIITSKKIPEPFLIGLN